MGLQFNKLSKEEGMARFRCESDVIVTGEGKDMALAGPKSGGKRNPTFLLARAGQEISMEAAEQLGLIKKEAKKGEDKASKKGEDKASKKGEDK